MSLSNTISVKRKLYHLINSDEDYDDIDHVVIHKRHKARPIQILDDMEIENGVQLYDYQQDIVKAYNEYYADKDNTKSVLVMPCATGKTIISCYVSKPYDVVIFISPLKQYAEQNIARYKSYDQDREYLLIDSDGTRDISKIKKFILDNKKVMLSVTYKSCDMIVQLFNILVNPIFIIDEFHDLSARNIYGSNDENHPDPLHQIITSKYIIFFMSATPRIYELEGDDDCDIEEILGKIVFKMSFGFAINKLYITDYTIYLPIMEDESKIQLNKLIDKIKEEVVINKIDKELSQKCCYLFECIKKFGMLKSIIYFRSHEEIENFIKCFNAINEYYNYVYNIDSITCDDSQQTRSDRIDKFKLFEGNSFLCAVRILDQCIDIPECDSIFVTYICNSKVKNVQRMSRAIRLNSKDINKKAKIFLWCNEISEMTTFISSVKEIDINYNQKVKFFSFIEGTKEENEKESELYSVKYNKYIVGIQEYKGYSLNWVNMLEKVDKFIMDNKKRPYPKSKNSEERRLGSWINNQQIAYKIKTMLMQNEDISTRWLVFIDKHIEYFRSNEEDWNIMINNIEKYIICNKKRPSNHSKNQKEQIMGRWLNHQQNYYKNKMHIMQNHDVYVKWTAFTNKYIEYFRANDTNWYITLDNADQFITNYKRKPSNRSKNTEEKIMGRWLNHQQNNYKNKTQIMINQDICNKWSIFMNKHKEYFKSNDEEWHIMLDCAEKFIIFNKRRPVQCSKNKDEKIICNWINRQQICYKNKTFIMKKYEIHTKWIEFTNKYIEYFQSNEEKWDTMLNNVDNFIMCNKKRPSEQLTYNKETKMAAWINTQQYTYNKKTAAMKNQEICDKWAEFVNKHCSLFK